MFEEAQANREFADFWNEVLAPKFIRFRHILVDGLSGHSDAAFGSLEIEEGERIVDVGCGFGDTAIDLGQRVGPSGYVLGIDCCEAFLEIARSDAASAGAGNVEFLAGDAQDFSFSGDFDFCFARFGAMFFENPVAGLRNMRTALKPGGRMMLLVWRTIDDNPWFGIPKETVLKFLPPPGEGARTCGPGPLSMANQEMVTKQLEIAGYDDIAFQRIDSPVTVGRDAEDAMEFQLSLGPAGEVFREAGDEAAQKEAEIRSALREELSHYSIDNGSIVMNSSSWMITARNP
jgi:SAM-dependent methyltransferase